MNRLKWRAALWFALALVCAAVGFLALFLGHTNVWVALGVAVMAFACFFPVFNRAWAMWAAAATAHAGVAGAGVR